MENEAAAQPGTPAPSTTLPDTMPSVAPQQAEPPPPQYIPLPPQPPPQYYIPLHAPQEKVRAKGVGFCIFLGVVNLGFLIFNFLCLLAVFDVLDKSGLISDWLKLARL